MGTAPKDVFSSNPEFEVAFVGINDAVNPITSEKIEWADCIIILNEFQRPILEELFKKELMEKRIYRLGNSEEFRGMDPVLRDYLIGKAAEHFEVDLL